LAIREFRMQNDPKGYWLPFATAHKAVNNTFVSHRKLLDSRKQYIFTDFCDYACKLISFAFCNILFRAWTKRSVQPFLTVVWLHVTCYMNVEQILYLWGYLSKKKKKNLQTGSVLFELERRLQYCPRNLRTASNADHVWQHHWETFFLIWKQRWGLNSCNHLWSLHS
jgi:hypothetical protein